MSQNLWSKLPRKGHAYQAQSSQGNESRSYKKKQQICIYGYQNKEELFIATDKALFSSEKMLVSFLFLHENICCGYSLEAPRRGASNEYPQHIFSLRNKKDKYYVDTPSYL